MKRFISHSLLLSSLAVISSFSLATLIQSAQFNQSQLANDISQTCDIVNDPSSCTPS